MDGHGDREIGTPKTLSSVRMIKLDDKLLNDIKKLEK